MAGLEKLDDLVHRGCLRQCGHKGSVVGVLSTQRRLWRISCRVTTPPRKLPTVQRGPTSLYSLAQLHAETFFAHGQAVTLLADYGRGYSYAEIARMIQFAQAFPEEAIVVTLSQQLSWSHFHARLPIKDPLTSAPKIQSHGLGGIQARHYDRHDYMPEKRAALQQWVQRFAGG